MEREAVVLLSGGLDSATVLAIAKSMGFTCRALTIDYGQRHKIEIRAAKRVAQSLGVKEHAVISLDLSCCGGSALTAKIDVPKNRGISEMNGIPATYVPARNSMFVAIAAGFAEARGARDLFIGVNGGDHDGYPDCRPEFIEAFERALSLGTKCGVHDDRIHIHTPLINDSKERIIARGMSLGVDYRLTISCYDPTPEGKACRSCDACTIRSRGFAMAGVEDPTLSLARGATQD